MKVRSAKGELVDFDVLKIKEQMASAPPPAAVRARRDFVDQRLRRRLKTIKTPVSSQLKLPETEDFTNETKMIDGQDPKTQTLSRQKARPKPTNKIENKGE